MGLHTSLHAIELDVLALLLVSRRDDWWDSTNQRHCVSVHWANDIEKGRTHEQQALLYPDIAAKRLQWIARNRTVVVNLEAATKDVGFTKDEVDLNDGRMAERRGWKRILYRGLGFDL